MVSDSIVGDFDAEDLFVATASSLRIWWVFDDLDLIIVEGRSGLRLTELNLMAFLGKKH